MLDPETQIVARELMLKTVDMMREFMKVLSTALLEQGASLVLDNGDKIAGITAKSIEGVGRAFVDGTLNSFSAVPFLGNFFHIHYSFFSITNLYYYWRRNITIGYDSYFSNGLIIS